MTRSAKALHEEEEDEDEELSLEKDGSSQKDGKSNNGKTNAPRSKHSVSEQRRRSKINERFQILREIIPDSELKRDKASFLIEVIQYIQFLQEKVQKYEASYQEWNQEPPTKLMPWRNSHGHGESMSDHSRAMNSSNPVSVCAEKFDNCNMEITPTMPENGQNEGESDMSMSAACKAIDQPSSLNKELPLPLPLPLPLQPNMFALITRDGAPAEHPRKPISEADIMASQTQSQLRQTKASITECPMTSDTMSEQEKLTIKRGRISISSAYSQGLLNSLTQALQNSGVDLSQANISIQIDLGKQAISELNTAFSGKDQDDRCSNRAMANSRVASSGEDSDQAQKRMRTDNR